MSGGDGFAMGNARRVAEEQARIKAHHAAEAPPVARPRLDVEERKRVGADADWRVHCRRERLLRLLLLLFGLLSAAAILGQCVFTHTRK